MLRLHDSRTIVEALDVTRRITFSQLERGFKLRKTHAYHGQGLQALRRVAQVPSLRRTILRDRFDPLSSPTVYGLSWRGLLSEMLAGEICRRGAAIGNATSNPNVASPNERHGE